LFSSAKLLPITQLEFDGCRKKIQKAAAYFNIPLQWNNTLHVLKGAMF
jgi:hypothetical protein